MKLCIIGAGYVGLVSGACFAEHGNRVICVDNDEEKVRKLKSGVVPVYEPGLEELVERSRGTGRLEFTTDIRYGVEKSDIIFIAVGTPPLPDGDADLSSVKEVAGEIAILLNGYKIVVNKSTVPVGTQKLVRRIIEENRASRYPFDVVSNPEFLREGSAVYDTMHPDRIIIGADSERAAGVMRELYSSFKSPVMVTDPETAEMIKYASNAFLATKISFINEIANICERVGADVEQVARGMGLDSRISPHFLRAGIGYGGSCFPKDTAALVRMGEKAGYSFEILKSVIKVNRLQRFRVVEKLQDALGEIKGKVIGILGLAFKPGTDDVRESPALDIIRKIQEQGGRVKAYDPAAIPNARRVLEGVEYCNDPYEAAGGTDAVILATEWDEFKKIDLQKVKQLMRRPVFIDGRNIFDPGKMVELGFEYYCIGRKERKLG